MRCFRYRYFRIIEQNNRRRLGFPVGDDQTTLALSRIMRHGRAIPIVWLTVKKSELKNRQTLHERTAVQMLKQVLSEGVRVTLPADRGFGNTIFFDHLQDLEGFDFVIRFRQGFYREGDGFSGKAADAVYKSASQPALKTPSGWTLSVGTAEDSNVRKAFAI